MRDGSDVAWRAHSNGCAERDPLIPIFQALESPAIRGALRVREERRVLGRRGAPHDGVLAIVALVAERLVVPSVHHCRLYRTVVHAHLFGNVRQNLGCVRV